MMHDIKIVKQNNIRFLFEIFNDKVIFQNGSKNISKFSDVEIKLCYVLGLFDFNLTLPKQRSRARQLPVCSNKIFFYELGYRKKT